MKKIPVLVVSLLILFSRCGKSAKDYKYIVDEYKNVMCIGMNNSSLTEKTKALQRQQELNKEFEEALKNLSVEEQGKLEMEMSIALANVAEGKCE